jgi:hypothetical protein
MRGHGTRLKGLSLGIVFDCSSEDCARVCRWCGRGERGGGDRRPDLANVELGGSGVNSIGCEMLTRAVIGREDVGKCEEDVSRMSFVESIGMTSGPQAWLVLLNVYFATKWLNRWSQKQSVSMNSLKEQSYANAIIIS